MIVHFFLRYRSEFGQQFFISGNWEILGLEEPEAALPMQYLDADHWHARVEVPEDAPALRYKYLLRNPDETLSMEWQADRNLSREDLESGPVHVFDFWNYPGNLENAFLTKPFRTSLMKRKGSSGSEDLPAEVTHLFRVKAPLLSPEESVCVVGAGEELGDWSTDHCLPMVEGDDWFELSVALSSKVEKRQYKYGVCRRETGEFLRFEKGLNRTLPWKEEVSTTIVHDGFIRESLTGFKAAGVAIPVFSLRSEQGFGIGEFADIPALADWCAQVGLKVIQVLPINDTTSNFSWTDSYPYAPISVFSLHPIYLNLEKVAGEEYAEILVGLEEPKAELNALQEIDYEAVLTEKLAAIHRLYQVKKAAWLEDAEYQAFYETNQDWLKPYAAFCKLRDHYDTADFTKWKKNENYDPARIDPWFDPASESFDQVGVHLFVQYQLHCQLKEAVDYAHTKGVILKGDLPIGIYRYSSDAWVAPELYNMEAQAGAPPDDFAVKGQNWGFPTYNWPQMQADGFAWWIQRFSQMSHYFDAFRIDHILGFFRIWSIPIHAVEGIMGRFVPCIPVRLPEFEAWGIHFDADRFTEPYITREVIEVLFGEWSGYVMEHFLEVSDSFRYRLKEDFNTQRKVEQALSGDPKKEHLILPLFDLISNVLLFPDEEDPQHQFHFRIRMQETLSFGALDTGVQHKLNELYIHYFYRRQDEFWRREALQKLPAIKSATDMLICGEDLGMVPESVPGVMRDLGFLSLEIQRMPKDSGREFFHPEDAPYLSVVTPSTHDMSTVRGWWEEDPAIRQRFFNQALGQAGKAPSTCTPAINRMIVEQHLHSPAMLSIFQLQDILGMDGALRREDPHAERINIPANPKHYWRYRMHLSLDVLRTAEGFNEKLGHMLLDCGRA